MKTVGWNILVLSFALLASGQKPKKKCPAPVEYPHTTLAQKYSGRQEFLIGEKVYYNCAEDFTPSRGLRVVQCGDGGQWTKLSLKCEKKSCGNAGDLPNGYFQYEGSTFVGEKVYAVCNEGYTVKGLNYRICKASGWSGDFPVCEEGETTCSAPAVANSVQRAGDVSVHRVGDRMTFTCVQGFQLDGAEQITCGPGGQWQPQPPRCLTLPDPTQPPSGRGTRGCGVPPNLKNSNANLADRYITKTSFPSGGKVYYVCDVGHTPTGGSRSRQCNDGEWTPLRLKCERKACGMAGEVLYGQYDYTGVEFGDTATAVCDEGYILVGQATRTCMSEGWSGRDPVCEAVDCDAPPKVMNAEMTGLQEPPYFYRNVVRYRCRVGTLVGEREIWCTKNGTWSAPPPQCGEITCPSPKVYNGFWARAYRQTFQYRETISIECRLGYTMTGPRTITCNRDGQWYPRLPECRRPMRRPHRRN